MSKADSTAAADPLRKALSCMEISTASSCMKKSSSNRGAAMDDSVEQRPQLDWSNRPNSSVEQWPPLEWPTSIDDCPYGHIFDHYLPGGRCWVESTDPKIKLFYKQVVETRGFDVTAEDINGVNPFWEDPCDWMLGYYDSWSRTIVEDVNKRAEIHGELYELDGFVKILTLANSCHLITIKVKNIKSGGQIMKTVQAYILARRHTVEKVIEWRFKPE